MKNNLRIKTSTRISIIFSIITFFILSTSLILLNVFYFLGWYKSEKQESEKLFNDEYKENINNKKSVKIQEKEFHKGLEELGGVIQTSENIKKYNPYFLVIYKNDNKYYLLFRKKSVYGDVFIPYNVTSYYNNQLRLVKIGLLLLLFFTLLSFVISKYLFITLALKDIFYISDKLKTINLNNIKNIKLNLNKNDEINIILESINSFLNIIKNNTDNLKKFNSHISHEFKTPLMVISSELEYLTLSGENKESYNKIERQIGLLNNFLETFLFISQIEKFNGSIKKDTISVNDLISEELNKLDKIYKGKKITIININPKKIKIQTNKNFFYILIKNILDNAYKYNTDLGKISIIISETSLRIKDTGIGIKKENISKIFDSLYRVNQDYNGYGIGLNIVKKIVNILKYEIEVISKEGKGTEFKIIYNKN